MYKHYLFAQAYRDIADEIQDPNTFLGQSYLAAKGEPGPNKLAAFIGEELRAIGALPSEDKIFIQEYREIRYTALNLLALIDMFSFGFIPLACESNWRR